MPNEQVENLNDQEKQVVVFKLGTEEFGASIDSVKEIRKMDDQKITVVPRTKEYIAGVVNLRGKIIPVIDLRLRFGMEKVVNESNRIIVIEVEDDVCGVIVDAVNEVIKIPSTSIEVATEMISGINKDYIEGIAKIDSRLVILVNLQLIALANSSRKTAI